VSAGNNSGGPEQADPESNPSKLAEETHARASEELATRTPVEAYSCPAKYAANSLLCLKRFNTVVYLLCQWFSASEEKLFFQVNEK